MSEEIKLSEIIEGNKLICEFLGFESNKVLVYRVPNLFPAKEDTGWTEFDVQDIGFERDWNLLMAVVEKIESINEYNPNEWSYNVGIEVDSCVIRRYCDGEMDKEFCIVNTDSVSKLEAVYYTVVEFIEWYNQIDKTK